MHRAEQLYMDGYTTYPRTESSSYPSSFNFDEVLEQLRGHSQYKEAIASIKRINPRKGVDAGDHPPITPTSRYNDSPDAFYNLIARNFVASLMDDCEYQVVTNTIAVGAENFKYSTKRYLDEGWMKVYRGEMGVQSS